MRKPVRIKIKSELLLIHNSPDWYLSNHDGSTLIRLNDSAASVWKLCEKRRNYESIVNILRQQHPTVSGIEKDVEYILSKFHQLGLIELEGAIKEGMRASSAKSQDLDEVSQPLNSKTNESSRLPGNDNLALKTHNYFPRTSESKDASNRVNTFCLKLRHFHPFRAFLISNMVQRFLKACTLEQYDGWTASQMSEEIDRQIDYAKTLSENCLLSWLSPLNGLTKKIIREQPRDEFFWCDNFDWRESSLGTTFVVGDIPLNITQQTFPDVLKWASETNSRVGQNSRMKIAAIRNQPSVLSLSPLFVSPGNSERSIRKYGENKSGDSFVNTNFYIEDGNHRSIATVLEEAKLTAIIWIMKA